MTRKKKKLKRQVDKRPPPHRSQSISSPKCCTSLGMPHSIYIDEAFEKRSLSQIRIAHTHLISLALNLNLSRYRKNCSTATDVFHFRNGGIGNHRSTIILSLWKSTRSCDRAIFLGDACSYA